MYSLPNQTLCDWKETLEKVVHLNPTHISAYSLILEEGTELYNMYESNKFELIDENVDIEMYEYTINYLKSKDIINMKYQTTQKKAIIVSIIFYIGNVNII